MNKENSTTKANTFTSLKDPLIEYMQRQRAEVTLYAYNLK